MEGRIKRYKANASTVRIKKKKDDVMNILPQNKEEFEITNVLTWQKDNLGEGITIVVLDSGDEVFDYMKEDYNIVIPFEDEDADTDHGTAVIATGLQIAPKAKVIYMPYLFNNKRKEIIDWIIEHKDEIDIINCSFSGAVRELRRLKGLEIPIICASGNDYDKDENGVNAPANFDFTIAVGSWNANLNAVDGYSNGGKKLTCVAPSWIYYLNSKGKAINQSGTSISSPFVTFSMALYMSWRKRNGLPKMTQRDVEKFIIDNALDLTKYGEGHDYTSGYGLFVLPSEIPSIEEVTSMDYFNDDNGRWHEKFNNRLAELGIVVGDGNGNVRPDDYITRAEVNKIVAVSIDFMLSEMRKMLGK